MRGALRAVGCMSLLDGAVDGHYFMALFDFDTVANHP